MFYPIVALTFKTSYLLKQNISNIKVNNAYNIALTFMAGS